WIMQVVHSASPEMRFSLDGSLKVQFLADGSCENGRGVWTTISDRRLKKNIKPMVGGSLQRLLLLQGVTYDYVSEELRRGYDGQRRGWIAQQVEDVFPEWVSKGADGMKMITPAGFDALVVEALRELRSEKDA